MLAPAAVEREISAPHILFRRALDQPGRTALRRKQLGLWRDIGWGEYAATVRAVGSALVALGVAPGERVAIIGETRPEWLYADLGSQAAGAVSVGIYTTNSAEEVAYILADCAARVFIVENEEQLEKALRARPSCPGLARIVVIDLKGLRRFADPMVMGWDDFVALGRGHESADPAALNARLAALRPDDTATLIYTSGTTGPPKGAMLSHRNVTWTARCLVDMLGIDEDDEVVSFLPLSHIAERMLSAYEAAVAGYRVNFVEGPDTVVANIREISPSLMFAVPRIWEKYQSTILLRMNDATRLKRLAFGAALAVGRAHARARLDAGRAVPAYLRLAMGLADLAVLRPLRRRLGFERLRIAVSGAAAISPDILRFFHAIGVPLRQVYGQTEGSGPTTCHQGERIDPADVGPPLPGVEVRIAADGEILVRGPNVFQGYLNHAAASAEALAGGWLHSGDLGALDPRGHLRILDRKKDLIITSGGKNIAPQPIENQLKFSPYVNDAIVIGEGRPYLVALIVLDEDNVAKFAQDAKVHYTTYASLTQAPAVVGLIRGEVARVNAGLARPEQVKTFLILPKKLLEEDGEVTPTLKVRRNRIAVLFAGLIEDIYRGAAGTAVG